MTSNTKPRWFFYPAWVALSTINILIAGAIAWALVVASTEAVGGTIQVGGHPHITEDYLGPSILILVLGLLAGSLQYLLLRRHLPRMRGWIAATTLGLVSGFVGTRSLFFGLHRTLGSTWFGGLVTTLTFGSMGLAQWLVLRQRVHHAGWWIPANVLGWGVVGWGAETLPNQIIPAVGILLVPSIATSIVLWLLLDQLPQRERSGRNLPPSSRCT